jgi:pyruvate kinase
MDVEFIYYLGEYPVEAVTYMSWICGEAELVEKDTDYPTLFETFRTNVAVVTVRKFHLNVSTF